MKRKVLILILIILLILALTGCRIIPLCCTEEMRAGQKVHSYWQAIINRQYELAKYYCIVDGIWYNKTDEWEEYINVNSGGDASLMIYGPSFYEQTEVIENNAVVYARITVDKIVFPSKNGIGIDIDVFEYEIELIKQDHPPGDWELK